MVAVIEEEKIVKLVKDIDLRSKMAEGFIQYSNGNAVVPPVGELLFEEPKGEAHIKYGYIKGADFYTIKIASGFYNNPELGVSSSQGLVLLFSQKTGQPAAVLLDNGKLTDLRTAAAGALVADHFAPKRLQGIGIIGAGIQAKLQLQFLLEKDPTEEVWIWARDPTKADQLKHSFNKNPKIRIAGSPSEVAENTNLIVTTTPSLEPLLTASDIRPGTHITAVGSDTAAKQELSSDLIAKADLVITDSLVQSQSRGEVYKARKDGKLNEENLIELGHALQNSNQKRTSDEQITIADLTGVAVQDIMIAEAVFKKYNETNPR